MSTARWTAIMDPRNFQDVRGGGPLYTMTKIELDPNPEKAKTQWRHLCVEHEQKLRMANKLWRANKELEVRCHCVEADTMQVRLALADASLARKRLMADNKWLEVLRNGAEAKLERTREVLDEVSQERRELVAKVQKARDTIEGLRQTLATREKELAEISVLKYRYEKYEARRGKPPEIMVLWGVALTLGVELTVAGCYVLIPMMV
ncbi:hypothetical protein F4859DRAFT_32858 [Xylaria cf. heliscus]|nr:hypothetical protein F4859DRAFT_32858 [Xylaria cf. heliscus]